MNIVKSIEITIGTTSSKAGLARRGRELPPSSTSASNNLNPQKHIRKSGERDWLAHGHPWFHFFKFSIKSVCLYLLPFFGNGVRIFRFPCSWAPAQTMQPHLPAEQTLTEWDILILVWCYSTFMGCVFICPSGRRPAPRWNPSGFLPFITAPWSPILMPDDTLSFSYREITLFMARFQIIFIPNIDAFIF